MSSSAMYQSFDAASKSAAMLAPSAPSYVPPFQPSAVAVTDQKKPAVQSEEGVPTEYSATIAQIKSSDYVGAFDAKGVTGDALVAGLNRVFLENQIPKGLKSKLTRFLGALLHFKIDDSDSMLEASNVLIKDLHSLVPRDPTKDPNTEFASRWEEAEDRLHRLMDILAYVPTGPITLSYFDRDQPGKRVTLNRKNQAPDDFLKEAHQTVRGLFAKKPKGNTPIFKNLQNMITEADRVRGKSEKISPHYLLSDGEPSSGISVPQEINLVRTLLEQRNAKLNPVTFLGCSNQRADYRWMHELEEVADNVAALCDFTDEVLEILRAQGPGFTYSRGMWLICNLAAALNPTDLDLLDLRVPLTKMTFDNLYGKIHEELEYSVYFNAHPNKYVFMPDYQLFLKTPNATSIPSVVLFRKVLKDELDRDIEGGDDDSEERELGVAAQAVINSRQKYAGYGGVMFNAAGNANDPSQPLLYPAPAQKDCCVML